MLLGISLCLNVWLVVAVYVLVQRVEDLDLEADRWWKMAHPAGNAYMNLER